jgi:hypothetical protein
LPIAYLASVLAGITPHTTVYEPSAGHGALLLGSNTGKVTVNELNPKRAEDLRSQGYTVTEQDATNYVPQETFDVVIMNPPFGSVEEGGSKKQWRFGEFNTTQIDQAIALQLSEQKNNAFCQRERGRLNRPRDKSTELLDYTQKPAPLSRSSLDKRVGESPSENPSAQQLGESSSDIDNDNNASNIIAPTFSPLSESELIPTPEPQQLTQQPEDNNKAVGQGDKISPLPSSSDQAIASESDELIIETWLQAVHDLGLEPERNHHIRNLMDVPESAKEITLSRYLKNIIEGDLEKYRPYTERGSQLLDTVQAIMAQTGQLDIWGGKTLKHNRYECVQKDETLTVQIKKGNKAETILRTEGDRIVSTTVKQKDLDQFTQLAQDMRLNILQQIDKHTR